MRKLSSAQEKALVWIVTEWDRRSQKELERWGKSFVQGRNFVDLDPQFRFATGHRLEELGMITMRTYRGQSEHLRRGSYGRWIGGSVSTSYVQLNVCPTDAGRAYVRELLEKR